MSPLQQSIMALRELIHFDAAQLVAYLPANNLYTSMWQHGYTKASIKALTYDFPTLYPPGFTGQLSPQEQLPPSISDCADQMYPPFLTSPIYQSALQPQGFQDGMTIELGFPGNYLGLAHFSSCQARVFGHRARTLARGAQLLLESALREQLPDAHAVGSTILRFAPCADQHLRIMQPPSNFDNERLAQCVAATKGDTLSCFWLERRRTFRLHAQRTGNGEILVTLTPASLPMAMTSAEMRVLSWLVAGLGDRDIARHLCLSARTVNSHVASLLRRMCVQRRTQVAALAAANNWFVPDPRGYILSSVPGLGN